jgi:uncharacterized membrane protein YhaH (DUF805 family)
MGFWQAVASGFSNYVGFAGRACRSEYWYWALFVLLVDIAASIIDVALGTYLLTSLVDLALFLPGLALGIRRLHDLDRSGWWVLIAFIPIIGWIILIIWACTKGTEGPNRFGPDRLAALGAH